MQDSTILSVEKRVFPRVEVHSRYVIESRQSRGVVLLLLASLEVFIATTTTHANSANSAGRDDPLGPARARAHRRCERPLGSEEGHGRFREVRELAGGESCIFFETFRVLP